MLSTGFDFDDSGARARRKQGSSVKSRADKITGDANGVKPAKRDNATRRAQDMVWICREIN